MPGADPGWWGHRRAGSLPRPWGGGTEKVRSPALCTQAVCWSVAPLDPHPRPNGAPAPAQPAAGHTPQPALLPLAGTKSHRTGAPGPLDQLSCDRTVPLRRVPASSRGGAAVQAPGSWGTTDRWDCVPRGATVFSSVPQLWGAGQCHRLSWTPRPPPRGWWGPASTSVLTPALAAHQAHRKHLLDDEEGTPARTVAGGDTVANLQCHGLPGPESRASALWGLPEQLCLLCPEVPGCPNRGSLPSQLPATERGGRHANAANRGPEAPPVTMSASRRGQHPMPHRATQAGFQAIPWGRSHPGPGHRALCLGRWEGAGRSVSLHHTPNVLPSAHHGSPA